MVFKKCCITTRTKSRKSEPFSCGRRVRIFGFIREAESGHLSERASPRTLPEIESSLSLIRSILTIKEKGCAPKDAPNLKKASMDGRAFPVGNVLLFFCRTAGLLCLPCGKGFLVLLIAEAFQNRWIETSGQPLNDFIRVARVVYSFFLFVQRHLLFRSTHPVDTGFWNPKCEKSSPHPLEAGKITSRNAKIPARSALPAQTYPEPPSWADDRAAKQKAKSYKNNVITSKDEMPFCRRARRAEDFHFPLFFMSGRNPGASACPDLILPEWAGRKARQIVHVLIPSYPTDQNLTPPDTQDAFPE